MYSYSEMVIRRFRNFERKNAKLDTSRYLSVDELLDETVADQVG